LICDLILYSVKLHLRHKRTDGKRQRRGVSDCAFTTLGSRWCRVDITTSVLYVPTTCV